MVVPSETVAVSSSASSAPDEQKRAVTLRTHQPGDMGWITSRHGAIYAAEHGFDASFEAHVGRITARFLEAFDPARERCWIAIAPPSCTCTSSSESERLGSVMLISSEDRATAKLRVLLALPGARGLGVGRMLVAEALRFAREAGYRKVVLGTHSMLLPARKLYAAHGFKLASTTEEYEFGGDRVTEVWELTFGENGCSA
ncbi:putative gnat-family acetyltransferase [Auricularia subglabra TFB-10046 SS5]|nr:putative gnat-family acetyltransferase [Auricularia subglabra TFB-10046 SS5]